MATYRVTIPPPSAKRMANNKTLRVISEDGWGQNRQTEYRLTDETEFTFTIDDDVQWYGATTATDAMTFHVLVEYTNSVGSRRERIGLVPQRIT